MMTKSKNIKRGNTLKKGRALISKKVKDYSNDPFFIKKAKKSQTFLEKNGFPKEILNKDK